MQTIRVRKEKIIESLTTHRAQHELILQEAIAGYRKHVIKELKKRLAAARKGEKIDRYINFEEPVNRLADYDTAIGMLELSVDDFVNLTEREYRSYVKDEWDWKLQFFIGNSAYSATAAANLG